MTKRAWWAIPTNVRRPCCLRRPCLTRRGHQTTVLSRHGSKRGRDKGDTVQGVPFSGLVSNANWRVLRGPHVHAPQNQYGGTTSGAHPHRGGSRGLSQGARVSLAKETTMFIATLQKKARHGHIIGSRPPKTYAPRWGRRHKPFVSTLRNRHMGPGDAPARGIRHGKGRVRLMVTGFPGTASGRRYLST